MYLLSVMRRPAALLVCVAGLLLTVPPVSFAQSKPQKSEAPSGNGKKNVRPTPPTEEERKKAEEDRKRAEEEKNAIFEPEVEKVESNVVDVDTVVYNKKTGQIVTGLKKENFAVFEDGVKQNITGFGTPESPITVTLILEYSRWTEIFGSAAGGGFEPGSYEVVRPVAQFLTQFIKPPNDYASVIAFDLRPTPLTDFTNDPRRLNDVVNLLLQNTPAFRENSLWDALKLALVGGKADSVVLENSKKDTAEYAGMVNLRAKRKAILLVASGIDTASKSNYSEIRRIIQESGIPIYIISTGNLFFKKYEQYLGPLDTLTGAPGRMTFLQAQNAMNTIAAESGGKHYPMTFESEVPGYLHDINTFLRNQYSLSYDLGDNHVAGKKYKLDVKVDVDGDGQFDDKVYVVQHRPFYTTKKAPQKKS